ncbi:MAG: hypothetical protein FWD57_06735 [Polyangiaceae bacterium]|nr:hypothetical protein [Polyangiaceae bacterium]
MDILDQDNLRAGSGQALGIASINTAAQAAIRRLETHIIASYQALGIPGSA